MIYEMDTIDKRITYMLFKLVVSTQIVEVLYDVFTFERRDCNGKETI